MTMHRDAAPVLPPPSSLAPLSPPPSLDTLAAAFAAMPREEAERLIDGYATDAVGRWQVVDAAFWQRVKFRSRLLRAAAGPFPCSPLPRSGKA